MARDYKNRSRNQSAGSRLAGLLTFIAGLVTGLCVAVGFVLVKGVPQLLPTGNGNQEPVVITTTPDQDKDAASTGRPNAGNKPEQETSTPKPKFDFYTILPEMEVSVPEWESESGPTPQQQTDSPAASRESSAPISKATEQGEAGKQYILQIGSFRQPDEAERVKAKLALLGINTEIQRVTIDDGDVWHRVRAGPYQGSAELNKMRQRLIDNNIDFMLLKLKQDNTG